LTGGIIQVPAECKKHEQKMGTGFTIYHFVESIENVSSYVCVGKGFFYCGFHPLTNSQTKKIIEELGGTTESDKEPVGEFGWYMYFKDVAGNRFSICERKK